MKNAVLIGVLMLGVLTHLFIGQACTDTSSFKTNNLSQSSSAIDSGKPMQKPVLDCSITDSAGKFIERITDLTSSTSYPLNPPTAPVSVKIDCSSSSSPTESVLSFAFLKDGVPLSSSGATATMSFSDPALSDISIQITDASGVNTKLFKFPVACDPSKYPPLLVNPNAISISAGSQVGYLNINLAGVASGGTGSYQYSLDLNGDGRFDNYNKSLYTSVTSLQDMYTLYSGTRVVGIRVLDSTCHFMVSGFKNVDFTTLLPPPQTGSTAQQTSYYYVQGNISPLTPGDSDLADKVTPFEAVEQAPVSGPPKHVICSYAKTSMSGKGDFSIKGINAYDDGTVSSGVSPALVHGIDLHVTNINDDGGVGPITGPATMSSISYKSAASLDGGPNQYQFNLNSVCTTNITVSRQTAATPCASGTGIKSPVVTIQGTYSCPNLHASAAPNDTLKSGKDISINSGYFYCQFAPADQCAGGGGGGGGEPPPVF